MSGETNVLAMNAAFWEKTFSDNFPTLCYKARRKLTNGNSYEAEDAVSEAFVRVMRYVQNPETIQNPLSYLWTAVRRVWFAQQTRLDASKTARLEDMTLESLESLDAVRVEPEVIAALDREDFLLELRAKLGPLSLEEETLIRLRFDGYSLAEIAAELGEDVRLTKFRWYRFIARQRYRTNKDQ